MPKTHKSPKPDQRDLAERRRCKRVALSFPIEVSGFDHNGQLFRERAVTLDVSEQGCKINLLREVECGDVVALRLVGREGARRENAKPLLFEVVWVEPSERGWTIGAMKLQGKNIWHIAFPAIRRPPSSIR